jgi:hypothetical protein
MLECPTTVANLWDHSTREMQPMCTLQSCHAHPTTLIDKHTNMGKYQFRDKDTSKDDKSSPEAAYPWHCPWWEANPRRAPPSWCPWAIRSPSLRRKRNKPKPQLPSETKLPWALFLFFLRITTPCSTNTTSSHKFPSSCSLPVNPNTKIYNAEGKTLPQRSSLRGEIIVCSLWEAQTKMRHSMQKRPYYRFTEMNVDFIDLDVNVSQINVSIGWMLLVLGSSVVVLGAEIKSCWYLDQPPQQKVGKVVHMYWQGSSIYQYVFLCCSWALNSARQRFHERGPQTYITKHVHPARANSTYVCMNIVFQIASTSGNEYCHQNSRKY